MYIDFFFVSILRHPFALNTHIAFNHQKIDWAQQPMHFITELWYGGEN